MEFETFPQPTRPTSYSNLTSFKYSTPISQYSEPIVAQISEPSTSTSNQDELFGELTRILFECLENADNVNKGVLLRKIFLELEKESQMENFIVEKLKRSHVKLISDFLERYPYSSTRQIGEDDVKYDQQERVSRELKEDLMEVCMTGGSKSEFSRKLERFKVKTVTIEGGVIKK